MKSMSSEFNRKLHKYCEICQSYVDSGDFSVFFDPSEVDGHAEFIMRDFCVGVSCDSLSITAYSLDIGSSVTIKRFSDNQHGRARRIAIILCALGVSGAFEYEE